MLPSQRWLAGLCAVTLLAATESQAADTCGQKTRVPIERQLRQLYLDLLGRPPSLTEYQAARDKGAIAPEDVQALMGRDEFYDRMRRYHRALFKANISASVFNNGDSRLSGNGSVGNPYGLRTTPINNVRGRTVGCDPNILQDDCNAFDEDPQANLGPKVCRDANGVPLPVSFDYDTNFFQCTQLDLTDASLTTCAAAVTKGALPDKYLYFCDMRRDAKNILHPFKCLPDPARSTTAPLTQEVLETGTNRVVSFAYPSPVPPAASVTQLDRCTLTLDLRNKLKGAYQVQRGCIQREGYVLVNSPFWETPTRQVAACAIEAQTRPVNPATLESCDTNRFLGDRSCGCGDGFRRCESGDSKVHQARINAFNTELELITDSVLRREEPYFNILTTRRSFMNGPLSSFYRERQGAAFFTNVTPPVSPELLPNLPYSQADTWVEYTRGDQHSGVLTTPAFLYRFPTYRARTNAFYDALLCQAFVPPAGVSFPPPEDACNRENNLAKRCGCKYCHATLEPTGAHWGRFSERGATYLDPSIYPRFSPKCRDCALSGDTTCGGDCANYVMQAYDGDGAQSLGLLKTYLYRTPSEEANIESGPERLVQHMRVTGDLERCAIHRVWNEFIGRPMTFQEEQLYLETLVNGFAEDNHNMKLLIRRILATDAYRRID